MDIDESKRLLEQDANKGDEEAMELLACSYYYGQNGFSVDDFSALYWSERVVSLYPNPKYDVWYIMGWIYAHGDDSTIKPDFQKAIGAYKKSIEQFKNPQSMGQLGMVYYYHAPQNEKSQCITWLKKAAELGDVCGARTMGQLYVKGDFVQKDYGQASKYFVVAVENGDDVPISLEYAGGAYFFGQYVEQNYELARNCFEKIENRSCDADAILGCMYFEGVGGPVRPEAGEKCLRHAMESDDTEISLEAMNNLGMYFYTLSNRLPEAIQLFQRAAYQGNANAQVNLGKAYCDGRGVPQSLEKAEHCFQLAAEQGNSTAQENLKILQSSNNTTSAPRGQGCSGCLIWTFVAMAAFAGLLHVLNFWGVFG